MSHSLVARGPIVAACLLTCLAGCSLTPTPLTETEISETAASRLSSIGATQAPIAGAIDLHEAIARALKYNLDHHVELAETALRTAELHLSHYAMLPGVVANSGYNARDRYAASSSYNLITQTPNFGASTSQEKRIRTEDVAISWNILDFGLSYVRARQAADKVLIAEEMRRKIANRIVEDVRTAYWRAVSAERLVRRLRHLEHRVVTALSGARSIARDGQASPITGLTYERELVEIKRTIQELLRELSIARSQLAALMSVVPGTPYKLVMPARHTAPPRLSMAVKDMMWAALHNRPELREISYRERISAHDADAALLELLPGLQLFAGANYDSNDYLYHNNWVSWGAKASWNLLKVFQYPAKREVIELEAGLLKQRALALSMAVMTQVHVARVRFEHIKREVLTAREHLDVQRRLLAQMQRESESGRVSPQTLIREEMNTLVSEARHDVAFANLQNAYANVLAAMGRDPYPVAKIDRGLSLSEIRASLNEATLAPAPVPAVTVAKNGS